MLIAAAVVAGTRVLPATAHTIDAGATLAREVAHARVAMAVPEFAERARLASRSLLLAVARAGDRVVAVGERGHVLLSDDHGATWFQSDSVPTRVLLTGVCFSDAHHGVAVGHDEIILTTRDAGRTWTRAHFAPESQQPLLDVACLGADRAIAVGAHGVYFVGAAGGWREASVGQDFHLNKIAVASSTRLYIAGEAGHLYRSDDAGETWKAINSGYEGSFFGIRPLSDAVVLAYGLRGNLYRSVDAGATWRKIETHTSEMLNDATAFDDGHSVAVVGLSGVVLISCDAGESFQLTQQQDRRGLSAVLPIGNGALLAVGEGGPRRLDIPPRWPRGRQ